MEYVKGFIYILMFGACIYGCIIIFNGAAKQEKESQAAYNNIKEYYEITDIRYYTKVEKRGYGSKEFEYIDACFVIKGETITETFIIYESGDNKKLRIGERDKTEIGVDAYGRYILFITREAYTKLLGFQSVNPSQIETEEGVSP